MLREIYMHPSGQIPRIRMELQRREPARARWATLFVHRFGQALGEPPDIEFLEAFVPGSSSSISTGG